MESDTYKTIAQPTDEILFKEKNSKFYGFAFPVTNEDQVKEYLQDVRKLHSGANHYCYAWQIGTQDTSYRANDDGEPANSAGMPIYGQIQSFNLTNVLVIAVRFFGGVKLGVGGLISTYRTTAQLALESATIIEKTIDVHFVVSFDYKNINKVMRIIKEKNLLIVDQKMHLSCQIILSVRKNHASEIVELFSSIFEVEVKEIAL